MCLNFCSFHTRIFSKKFFVFCVRVPLGSRLLLFAPILPCSTATKKNCCFFCGIFASSAAPVEFYWKLIQFTCLFYRRCFSERLLLLLPLLSYMLTDEHKTFLPLNLLHKSKMLRSSPVARVAHFLSILTFFSVKSGEVEWPMNTS